MNSEIDRVKASKDKMKRHRDNWKARYTELSGLVKELIDMLDTVEESDSGTEFHPTYFSSCRVMHCEKFDRIFDRFKEIAKEKK